LNFELNSKTFMLVSFALFMILTPSVSINTSQAQPIQQQQPTQSKPPASLSPTPSSLSSKIHAVKITSPIKSQQVPIGKDLTIGGTSLANASSNCQVSVIVNHVKPYQSATATGLEGIKDYSKWNFILIPKYAAITPGPNNKITAKYSCINDPSVVSYNSVNVTGVPPAVTSAATIQQPQKLQQQQSGTLEKNNSSDDATTSAAASSGLPRIPGIP
jgi:hypothetical protein